MKRKKAVSRTNSPRGRLLIDVLDEQWPGFARTVRTSALRRTNPGFLKDAPEGLIGVKPKSRAPGFDLLLRFINEQRLLYPDAPAARELASRLVEIVVLEVDVARALDLVMDGRPPGARNKDQRLTRRIYVAMREHLDKQTLPLKPRAVSNAKKAVAEKLGLGNDQQVSRRWKQAGGDLYEWDRRLREELQKTSGTKLT